MTDRDLTELSARETQHERERQQEIKSEKAHEKHDAKLKAVVTDGLAELEAALADEWSNEAGNAAKANARAALARLKEKLAAH